MSMFGSWINYPIPTGVPAVMMGITSFVYMFEPIVNLTPLTRALWIAAICLLGAAEIGAICRANNQRQQAFTSEMKQKDEQFEKIMKRFEQQGKASDSHELALLRLTYPAEGVKKKALQLSESIADFIYERIRHLPPLPSVGNLISGTGSVKEKVWGSPEWQKVEAYEKTTFAEYDTRFSKKVREIRDAMAGMGLVDEQLESLYQDPKESGYIRIIGERIGELAEKIA
jgi:hypothetical protein